MVCHLRTVWVGKGITARRLLILWQDFAVVPEVFLQKLTAGARRGTGI